MIVVDGMVLCSESDVNPLVVSSYSLIDTVTAVNQACPLCRKPLNELIPGGVDGDQLRFGAQIRISMGQSLPPPALGPA